ncbi:MAG TPA: phenylalanine--tRNA ligase subunit beta, partial [Planctomycetota bacterium]|nr:phenylalanine--tRNA ligase subunit beta [Planctomycetota bacterium]
LVDLSNFVMLDLGQPNHAFDRSRISQRGIVVRRAHEGERMTTLDGVERALVPQDLLITDGDRPVALAGIMGGADSKVEGDTSQLLLEVATFAPGVIRRTSARLGLRSDSSARFEKHLDPVLPMIAAGHFANLLRAIQPQVEFPLQLTDAGTWTDPARRLSVRPARIRSRLGVELSDAAIVSILSRLGLTPKLQGDQIEIQIPSSRATKDLALEEDVVEEVGRIHRYGNIPTQALVGDLTPPPADPRRRLVRKIQDRLAGAARFRETIQYSFLTDSVLDAMGLAGERCVEVQNPVAEGQGKLRRSLLPNLLEAALKNRQRHGQVALFEVGKGYLPEAANAQGEPMEIHTTAAVLAWPAKASQGTALEHLHAVARDLLLHLGHDLAPAEALGDGHGYPAWLHPKKRIALRSKAGGQVLGFVAQPDPAVQQKLGFDGDVASDLAVLELSIDRLLEEPTAGYRYRALPKFPEVKVDVAILAPDSLPGSEVMTLIEAAGKGIVVDIELFDQFRGEALGADRRSLAFHVKLGSEGRTLTDKDNQKFLDRLARTLEAAGAELRRS